MEPRQAESDDADSVLEELMKQCELLHAATMLARSNAVEAYKVALSGASFDPTAALVQYQTARALQQVAEQALTTYLQTRQAIKGT